MLLTFNLKEYPEEITQNPFLLAQSGIFIEKITWHDNSRNPTIRLVHCLELNPLKCWTAQLNGLSCRLAWLLHKSIVVPMKCWNTNTNTMRWCMSELNVSVDLVSRASTKHIRWNTANRLVINALNANSGSCVVQNWLPICWHMGRTIPIVKSLDVITKIRILRMYVHMQEGTAMC